MPPPGVGHFGDSEPSIEMERRSFVGAEGFLVKSGKGIAVGHPEVWLPKELAMMIFEWIQSVEDVASVRGVCKQWKMIIDEHHLLWRRMVFRLPRRLPDQAEKWLAKQLVSTRSSNLESDCVACLFLS